MNTLSPPVPLSYLQIMKQSFRLYRVGFKKVILLSLMLSIIVFIPRLISDIIGQDIFSNVSPFNPHRLWLLILNLIEMIFLISMFWHLHCVLTGHKEPLAEDLIQGLKKIFYLFVATLIQGGLIFIIGLLMVGIQIVFHHYQLLLFRNPVGIFVAGFILLAQFILVLYSMTLFIFLLPLIAIENKGILSAIEKSVLLAWNHWWRIFSAQCTPWICYAILLMIVKFVFHINIHLYFIQQLTPTSLLSTLINLIIMTFFIPWVAALLIVQLNDLELRKKILI